jgi:hypothetical protein
MIFSCLEQLLTISYLICGSEKSDMQKQTGERRSNATWGEDFSGSHTLYHDSSILAQEFLSAEFW